MQSKLLSYGYPTSDLAKKHNNGNGCFVIRILDDMRDYGEEYQPFAVFDHSAKWFAVQCYRSIDLPVALFSFDEEHFANWQHGDERDSTSFLMPK